MKILYVTTVAGTMTFFVEHIKMLRQEGHSVEMAANTQNGVQEAVKALGCVIHHLPFSRSPFCLNNLKAYKQLKMLLAKNSYDIIHTHTPIASALVRLACQSLRKSGLKVFYTAHGFHFYKGAPLKNWLLYYPAELVCSYFTDVLITINKEDYEFAKNRLHASKTYYVPGVGVDLDKFKAISTHSQAKREELKIPSSAVWLLAVGELNVNKNHEQLIRAVADFNNCYLTIAGTGGLNTHLTRVINELGLQGRVKLLGYRSDIFELYDAADVFALPSIREGLSVALMEAMAAGKPVICSKIRGNTDLIDQNGGELFNPHSTECIKQAIAAILKRNLRELGLYNLNKIKHFDLTKVTSLLKQIYTAA